MLCFFAPHPPEFRPASAERHYHSFGWYRSTFAQAKRFQSLSPILLLCPQLQSMIRDFRVYRSRSNSKKAWLQIMLTEGVMPPPGKSQYCDRQVFMQTSAELHPPKKARSSEVSSLESRFTVIMSALHIRQSSSTQGDHEVTVESCLSNLAPIRETCCRASGPNQCSGILVCTSHSN